MKRHGLGKKYSLHSTLREDWSPVVQNVGKPGVFTVGNLLWVPFTCAPRWGRVDRNESKID
jgi:hypothetical protein